jgi:hypothetical protein
MALNDEQLQRLNQWFKEKGVSDRCPSCGEESWFPPDLIVGGQYREGNIYFTEPVVPMVRLTCTNCMFVRLYAAVPIGLTK